MPPIVNTHVAYDRALAELRKDLMVDLKFVLPVLRCTVEPPAVRYG